MLKQHRKALILSSVVILLPIFWGLLLWNQLPDVMATHWGVDNQPDGWSSKTFAVFFMPLLLLGLHWLCLWITSIDKRQKNQTKKAIAMIFWLMPMVSIFCCAIMYGIALGNSVNMTSVLFIMMGLMFVFIGNYMPKTKQNSYLGIKVIWTLNNEENWNATHRFGGKAWVFGGLLLALAGFFPMEYAIIVMLPVIFALVISPILYSYLYYKKQCREGRSYSLKVSTQDKKTTRFSMIAVTLILIIVAFLMLSGDIRCEFSESSFTIDASFYDDLTVEYDAIESIEIRYESIPGTREMGFASAKLLLGTFRNNEFGQHARYTYTGCECAVIIQVNNKTLVLAGKDTAETERIYATLLEKTGSEG